MSTDEHKEAHGAKEGSDFAGCWDIRGPGIDALFSGQLGDTALTAVLWTDQQFDRGFPGWALYRTVVSGDRIFDRKLEAYAIGMARAVARAKRKTGHSEVAQRTRRNGWLKQAARDALFMVVHGKQPLGAIQRGQQFNVSHTTYIRVRDAVAGGMTFGLEAYRAMLFANVHRARIADSRIGG
jgi:hypothetical protein